ncbi:hypothetical protein PR048_011907 [Dryococelus australis]|uniref:Uncharacterized protein n=1 Tax=Dryococelus australis TaxID=614101 RepID=A0ABQ9HMZ0_9NEOP|nr:hypothetical protein PR048_011907 [Dryococelus australis]
MEFCDFQLETVKNILCKCPVHYSIVGSLNCLDLREIGNSVNCTNSFTSAMKILVEARRIQETDYSLLHERATSNSNYGKLWFVLKMLLILSHGQVAVERSFSVNRHIEVEMMQEHF